MPKQKKIRYAVIGLGHIAQVAVLPGFKKASRNSELTALVSGDAEKLKKLGRKYSVPNLYSYEEFDACLESGSVDAVYIATPNTLHQEFAEKAARRGIHVLTEKPMAVSEEACMSMLRAAEVGKAKLMVAYRLHFDHVNLRAIEMARKQIGELKFFNSVFSMQVRDRDNIRLRVEMGGGSLYDIGIYCINAARYLFGAEPTEVFAMAANSGDTRFREIDEITTACLRFPGERLATFTTSFGAADSGSYDLVGTEGRLRVENAYDYAEPMELLLMKGDRKKKFRYKRHDQFAPELLYFSECILKDRQPEPSGLEGLADVRIIRALLHSAAIREPVVINQIPKKRRPSLRQEMRIPASAPPNTFHARGPSAH